MDVKKIKLWLSLNKKLLLEVSLAAILGVGIGLWIKGNQGETVNDADTEEVADVQGMVIEASERGEERSKGLDSHAPTPQLGIPEELLLGGDEEPGRTYVPLGRNAAGAPVRNLGASSTSRDRSTSEREYKSPSASNVSVGEITPVLVQRTQASQVRLLEVFGGSGARSAGGVWNIPGACRSPLAVTGIGADIRAEERRAIGDWVFALAVPDSACTAVSRHVAPRSSPTREERVGLALALDSSPVIANVGGRGFGSSDLKELSRFDDPRSGRRVAAGVFQKKENTTRMFPPAKSEHLSFVASTGDGHTWDILWASYNTNGSETVTLAGVYDLGVDGVMDAFFAIRAGEGGRLVRTAGSASDWSFVNTARF